MLGHSNTTVSEQASYSAKRTLLPCIRKPLKDNWPSYNTMFPDVRLSKHNKTYPEIIPDIEVTEAMIDTEYE